MIAEDISSLRETAAEAVSDIILSLCSCINKPQYMPKMPTQKEVSEDKRRWGWGYSSGGQ